MIAINLVAGDTFVGDAPSARSPTQRDDCDFSGDGRIVDGLAVDRSAFACPLFYGSILICPVLFLAAAIVRFWCLVSEPGRRPS